MEYASLENPNFYLFPENWEDGRFFVQIIHYYSGLPPHRTGTV
jgi:hypothetical protein